VKEHLADITLTQYTYISTCELLAIRTINTEEFAAG
jgi:hypothetical protein